MKTSLTLRCGTAALLLASLASCGGGDPATTRQGAVQGMRTAAATATFDYSPAVQQLYIAYFARPADPQALKQFKAQLAQLGAPPDTVGLNIAYHQDAGIRNLIETFAASEESAALYPRTSSTTNFVQAIYFNVLGRLAAADDPGVVYWVNAIDQRQLTRTKAALSILAGAQENKTEQGLLDAKTIKNRAAMADKFTAAVPEQVYRGEAAARLARSMILSIESEEVLEEIGVSKILGLIDEMSRLNYFPAFVGTYQATISGGDQGTFTFTIDKDGKIEGSGSTTQLGQQNFFGQLKKPDGLTATVVGGFALATRYFDAVITTEGKLTGTWGGPDMQGSISATRK